MAKLGRKRKQRHPETNCISEDKQWSVEDCSRSGVLQVLLQPTLTLQDVSGCCAAATRSHVVCVITGDECMKGIQQQLHGHNITETFLQSVILFILDIEKNLFPTANPMSS